MKPIIRPHLYRRYRKNEPVQYILTIQSVPVKTWLKGWIFHNTFCRADNHLPRWIQYLPIPEKRLWQRVIRSQKITQWHRGDGTVCPDEEQRALNKAFSTFPFTAWVDIHCPLNLGEDQTMLAEFVVTAEQYRDMGGTLIEATTDHRKDHPDGDE